MRITIRLFGRLHDLAGASELEREVPMTATVASVWQMLAAEFPTVAPYARSVSAAVNADFVKTTTTLAEGDEVAFLPPVSGGM
ncbi:MAG TPA: molybdopterin converting factor subunit 1 [Vicinamibacterales bacterium]|jgi:molybdopterin converting factor subunit 1